MGLLSNLLKVISSVSTTTPASNSVHTAHNMHSANNPLRDKLESIIASEFSEYELRKDIPASEMTSNSGARDYSYGLYLNGSPKAFIMIMKDRNDYKKRDVVLARQAAESNGIPYMNFIPHLPNEPEYISNRLRQNVLR